MHLLSSNAVRSAARAGSEGDAFRVLTQDIQLLGDEVSECIGDTQKIIGSIVRSSSGLAQLFTNYMTYVDLQERLEDVDTVTSKDYFNRGHKQVTDEIRTNNYKLSRSLGVLTNLLAHIATLVKKGEYLAVCSSVEAASAGEHGVSFEAVSKMLRELVGQLGEQSARQRSLLRDLTESMEKQQINQRNLPYAR